MGRTFSSGARTSSPALIQRSRRSSRPSRPSSSNDASDRAFRPIRDTLGFTQLIVRTVLYFNPLKVLYPVAGVVLVALAASLYYDTFVVSPPNLSDKTTLLAMAMMNVLSVGLLADLLDKRTRL